ncbi:head GIN domain-containing protein [Danxiaibacter flavus]|uniref:Head GIN domain-containing protein n=1 Tax=Danxiaibacter flavus TaxID=3049108 RepID=A0ABV3ZE31_9BACT|nr:head GIN domain-containing protein [Chitinophagaceae bacterium DXS]
MRTIKSLLLLTIVLASLSFVGWKTIKGNGVLKKETRQMADFNGLASGGPVNVTILYGSNNSIEVEGDENVLPHLETYVKDNKLNIRPENGVTLKSQNPIRVTVSMTKMTEISMSGSGEINGEGNFSNDAETEINMSGSGNIKLAFGKFKDLSISMSGSGNIQLKGSPTGSLSTSQSGSGNINCTDVEAENVSVKISGSGNAKVNATKSIDARISGSGDIYYKGTPQNVDSKVAGSGRIQKL